MKTIVFVNPPLTLQARYGALAPAGATEPPFGLCYLAATTRQRGYRTRIVDAEALGLTAAQTADRVLAEEPDYVGITATTPAVVSASRVAEALKERDPRPPVILGGCHVSAIPNETLRAYPAFDLAVVGEGELAVCDLLACLGEGGDPAKVAGVAVRRNGNISVSPRRPLIRDLDSLPMPAFDLLPELGRHYRVTTQSVDRLPAVSLITSRGCYAQCTFCDTNVTGKTMRAHSAGYVLHMMRTVRQEYGIRCVMFEDDNFLAFRKRLREMADLWERDRMDMTWSCMSRADIADGETLRLAKRMGCWQVLYGVETGSQEILDFYRKRTTLEQTERALHLSKQAGLYTKGFIIIGNPLETHETLEKTCRFVQRIALDDISITFFTPYPGAEIFGSCEQYGAFTRDWEKMSCFEIVFVPNGMTRQTLEAYQKKIFREFYFRIPILAGYLRRIKTWQHFTELVRSGLTLARHSLGTCVAPPGETRPT